MRRALFFCTLIVAAFQLQLAAASPNVEDAPVTPAVAAIAARLGIDAGRDRAVFLSDLTRLLSTSSDRRDVADVPGEVRPNPSDFSPVRVPVPLPAPVWARAVFHRTVSPDGLIDAIVADRRAVLIARGLTGLDDETLGFLAEHASLLTFLHERAAAPFAAFGENFHVSGGRVVVPGGPEAEPLWEAVVHQRVSAPEQFARGLFGDATGRLAYLYGVVASADRTAAAFTLGFWIPDPRLRLERFARLVDACVSNYGDWRLDSQPFSRPLNDLAVLLLRLRLRPTGEPAAPASRAFWGRVFDVGAGVPGESEAKAARLIDAAWLVDATAGGDMYSRGERLDQFAFGQRVFTDDEEEATASGGGEPSTAEAVSVLRSFRGYRMLLLTLERLGVRRAAVYTAALQQAAAVAAVGQSRRFWATAQYQGVLALVSRMYRAGTIGSADAERLVLSFARVPIDDDGRYHGRVADWITTDLAWGLPADGTWEERIAAALAGPSAEVSTPRLSWEGQFYRVDPAAAERRRLAAIRAKQGGHTVDLALAIQAHARRLQSASLSADAARAAAAAIRATAGEAEWLLRRSEIELLAPGVDPPVDGFQWLLKAADEVVKFANSGELRRAARVGLSISDLAEVVLGNALVSIAYAIDLGSVDGAALLGANVALRHDFGFARRDGSLRVRMPWFLPRQDYMPGVPWHISGSLLGLEIALAPLALRRLTLDGVPEAPRLTSIEREAFAVGIGLMEPARLTDRDRELITAAIVRGGARLKAMAAGAESPGAIAAALRIDGRRVRAAAWTLEHDPAGLASRFSLAELLVLGGGAPDADLDAWGATGVHVWGCACTRFPPTGAWRVLSGRAQLPFMAGTMTELNLSIALMMSEMKLPTALTRVVLASAMRDLLDESRPADSSDWWGVARAARAVRRQRVEDYVAAAAAVDGPLVPEPPGASPQP